LPYHRRFVNRSALSPQALSLSKGAPPTTANDKHYQCYTTWPRNDEYGYLGLRSQLLPVRQNLIETLIMAFTLLSATRMAHILLC